MTFDGLMQTLRDRAADLSPQLQRAAMLLETHQRDIALLSMRDLARRCDLPPATFSRLARALDRWRKYVPTLRDAMQDALKRVAAHPSLSRDVREIVGKALA
ncbi:aminopeptidase N C-terminal domain-containing protein [Salmonella enterica subsp. enterica serovar Mbandaka]|uniref:aminopeptidase N C-terminal domain-containing protein n=1 Tax=Salmonella enterica TaxID=28901 RepID=UPI002FF8DD21